MNAQDPRYDEYRRKCAELDGFYKTEVFCRKLLGIKKVKWEPIPTYLDDAIDRVVRLLDEKQLRKYTDTLIFNLGEMWQNKYRIAYAIVRATTEQKAEALCRTLIRKEKG